MTVCSGPVSLEVRGDSFSIDGIEHATCEKCGEVYLTLDASEALQKEAIRLSKSARGLLSPDEILSLRTSLSLSQAAFEQLLGVGPKTVIRWEKGTVYQGATADRLMRLIFIKPELATVLASGELYEPARVCTPR